MNWLIPDWPAPANVKAVITTREGGVSRTPYASMNLADHVGDEPADVESNRAIMMDRLALPLAPSWLSQIHGCRVVDAEATFPGAEADGIYARRPGYVCPVLTADCLPLLICDRAGTRVCAVHAGWRGLADGIVENAICRLGLPAADLLVWLGPAIGPQAFEVGENVYDAFVSESSEAKAAFTTSHPGHWLADIYLLARQRLAALGVGYVGGGDYCTVTERERFFSYRRDVVTGRMASLIWLVPEERS